MTYIGANKYYILKVLTKGKALKFPINDIQKNKRNLQEELIRKRYLYEFLTTIDLDSAKDPVKKVNASKKKVSQ